MCRGATETEPERADADGCPPSASASPRVSDAIEKGMDMGIRGLEELFAELRRVDDVSSFLHRHDMEAPDLASFLNEKLAEKGLRRSEVLREAQIEQTFGWYVFKGKRGMGRTNVIKLCLVMELDAHETNFALQAAGASVLYPLVRHDAIVIWCLEHRVGLQRANEVLYSYGEDCL